MKSIQISPNGLKFFGFSCLTGEACSYSMRLLYDVSERGKRHFEAFIGNIEIKEGSNWNSGFIERKGEEKVKSVGSILLPTYGTTLIKKLMIFCALQEDYHILVLSNSIEISKDEKELEKAWNDIITLIPDNKEYNKAYKIINNRTSGRNTHQMSGRDT